ncbi:MAG: DUF3127 domain-containing protein [Prevotellaceae bacterium]|nr:DUF3127 domain-containing protein [Prevotellaceae bacterium]
MALELIGKLIKTLPVQSGTSARGTWSKQDFIIETQEQYPRMVCMTAWGGQMNELSAVAEGDVLKISFDIESREFNERWYTNVKAWRIEKQQAGTATAASPVQTVPGTVPPPSSPPPTEEPLDASQQEVDDLPF